jgi:hypothetical protein
MNKGYHIDLIGSMPLDPEMFAVNSPELISSQSTLYLVIFGSKWLYTVNIPSSGKI